MLIFEIEIQTDFEIKQRTYVSKVPELNIKYVPTTITRPERVRLIAVHN